MKKTNNDQTIRINLEGNKKKWKKTIPLKTIFNLIFTLVGRTCLQYFGIVYLG